MGRSREGGCIAVPHVRRWDRASPAHICTGLSPAASALSSPLPHRRQDWARPGHICAGTGLAPPASAPRPGFPLPHLRNRAHPASAQGLGCVRALGDTQQRRERRSARANGCRPAAQTTRSPREAAVRTQRGDRADGCGGTWHGETGAPTEASEWYVGLEECRAGYHASLASMGRAIRCQARSLVRMHTSQTSPRSRTRPGTSRLRVDARSGDSATGWDVRACAAAP
jgi:hypothetical protein